MVKQAVFSTDAINFRFSSRATTKHIPSRPGEARPGEGEVTPQIARKRDIDSKEQIGLADSPQGVVRS